MKWEKLGRVYQPAPEDGYSHAMFPVAEVLDQGAGVVRVYYTHRDRSNYGFPTYMDVAIDEKGAWAILRNHHQPIIDRAPAGHFDDSGVNVTSIVHTGNTKRFYYYGWNLGVTVPFRNSIGVAAQAGDAVCLERLFPGPILDRSRDFPHFCATPFVLIDEGRFKMWFASGEPWRRSPEGSAAVSCSIGYAESADGIDWIRAKQPAVSLAGADDHVVSTPWVIRDGDSYRMWYSRRGDKYRIGYAESRDGKVFMRRDEAAGIGVSDEGWDSEMICYPCVFDLRGARYLLYCGNDYGREGFGLAVLRAD